MKRDIEISVSACRPCQEQRNPKPTLGDITLPSSVKQPMLHTACNIFSAMGKQWLALVDRYSGFGWTAQLRKLNTKVVSSLLENWFNDFGCPTHIQTDGGPQLRSEFKEFCALYGIMHELSSSYTLCSHQNQMRHQTTRSWTTPHRQCRQETAT